VNYLKAAKILFSFGCITAIHAQSNPGISAEVKRAYTNVKNNLLNMAEKMPEENYSFKPTPEIRSFGEVLSHVAMAQSRACSAIAGGDAGSPNPSAKTTKADIISALHEAFATCDKAYDSLTDANASESIKTPRGQSTRLGALVGNTTHDTEQFGILTVYMRLKGVAPMSK